VTFRVDADGLLSVAARETKTGVEQKVEVRPSYGLTDEQVEEMLLTALDHGEEDFERRKLVEAKVEGEQVLRATRKALAADGDLLEAGERAMVEKAVAELEAALAGESAAMVSGATEGVDRATHGWAGRRMDRAVAAAMAGKDVGEVERGVEGARGVDVQVEEHAQRASGGAAGGGR
jgi:molecular chaperone HscA